jgi:hypothetical protein
LQENEVTLSRYRLDTQTGSKKERAWRQTEVVVDCR